MKHSGTKTLNDKALQEVMGTRDENASEAKSCTELLERAKRLGFSTSELERMQEIYGCDWDLKDMS